MPNTSYSSLIRGWFSRLQYHDTCSYLIPSSEETVVGLWERFSCFVLKLMCSLRETVEVMSTLISSPYKFRVKHRQLLVDVLV
jgi:hypothetical protein